MPEGTFTGIAQKLLYVQQNLKAPKGQYNKFGDYHYRSCEDIQEALKPLLGKVGAVLLLSDELVQIGDRFYIRATAIFRDAEGGESISNTAYARECDSRPKMDTAQITGSCSSYARKYALNGLFCIDDSRDPDTMDNSTSGQGQAAQGQKASRPQTTRQQGNAQARGADSRNNRSYVSQQHINTIRAEIERTGAKEKAVCYQYHIKSLQEMTMQQYEDAMKIFGQMPDKMDQEEYQMTLEGIAQYENELPFA
ncbi:MAG: ERF family protein [Lachnospiraceae bacterium]|nr:ERF family protein [Lachnospiraceae bacterium]